jgi:hypothetical protein
MLLELWRRRQSRPIVGTGFSGIEIGTSEQLRCSGPAHECRPHCSLSQIDSTRQVHRAVSSIRNITDKAYTRFLISVG